MVNYLTRLKIADNCGARFAQCIKILGGSFVRSGGAGSVLVIVVKRSDPKKKKVRAGFVFRGLLVRCGAIFYRGCGLWINFNQNAVVVVNKRVAPYAKRLRGPMIKEICVSFNFLGTITRFLV